MGVLHAAIMNSLPRARTVAVCDNDSRITGDLRRPILYDLALKTFHKVSSRSIKIRFLSQYSIY